MPPKNTNGVTIIKGIRLSFSQLLAQIPIMKPNNENASEVSIRNKIIQNGWTTVNETKRFAVIKIIIPMKIKF